ncbi:hypothetical protein J4439_00150 [Candidatus Woesearchaeota archaeon]|nr:hypothetical protein [Candidatus Woesearchaeota archaeon]
MASLYEMLIQHRGDAPLGTELALMATDKTGHLLRASAKYTRPDRELGNVSLAMVSHNAPLLNREGAAEFFQRFGGDNFQLTAWRQLTAQETTLEQIPELESGNHWLFTEGEDLDLCKRLFGILELPRTPEKGGAYQLSAPLSAEQQAVAYRAAQGSGNDVEVRSFPSRIGAPHYAAHIKDVHSMTAIGLTRICVAMTQCWHPDGRPLTARDLGPLEEFLERYVSSPAKLQWGPNS